MTFATKTFPSRRFSAPEGFLSKGRTAKGAKDAKAILGFGFLYLTLRSWRTWRCGIETGRLLA